MTNSVKSLVDSLEHLYLFGETFGLHTKKGTSVAVEITQAIERLERVYTFDKKCVDAVKNLTGITAVTQGPQGTVSSVVMEDETWVLSSRLITRTYLSYALQRHTSYLRSRLMK